MTLHSTSDPSRPHYHFTPPTAWLNDPNGMVYHNGEYHLFYQYYPDSLVWGPMHWGHAVSRDLLNWEHLPIALYPDELGMIFSGSAVVDVNNTAGFGAGTMVAIFTHHTDEYEIQSLGYSHDNGRTWTKYEGNPVLKAPDNTPDFRDPRVFWYEADSNRGHWVMALAVGNSVMFYNSPDLKTWTSSGKFGSGYGSTEGVWETPELFSLNVDGSSEVRWVLVVAVGNGAPAGGSGVQYFVGDFDGKTFTTSAPEDQVLWADYGADFYAPQLWNNEPDGRRIGVAWMNNWLYARLTPAETYRGAFTVPREFSLTTTADGVRLVQQPIPELQKLRGAVNRWDNLPIRASGWRQELTDTAVEIIAQWRFLPASTTERLTVTLQWGESARVIVGYDCKAQTLFVDRSRAGEVAFHPAFAAIHHAPLMLQDGTLQLRLLVDRQMLELFAEEGRLTVTGQIFPPDVPLTLEIGVDRGEIQMTTLEIYNLDVRNV